MSEERKFRWERLGLVVFWIIVTPLAVWGLYALGAYVPLRVDGIAWNEGMPRIFFLIASVVGGFVKVVVAVAGGFCLFYLSKLTYLGIVTLWSWLWGEERLSLSLTNFRAGA